MPLNFTLEPKSTGAVFLSKESLKDTVPNIPLPPDHAFHALWKGHLAELTGTKHSLYDSVIDALVSICQGTPHWKKGMDDQTVSAIKSEMLFLLSSTPPDIICVDGMTGAYAYHQRQEHLWPYISISLDYITLWMDSPLGSRERAGLTALLKTCLDHEIGHWVFTLKMGWFEKVYCSASNLEDPGQSIAAFRDLELECPGLIKSMESKHTPKGLQAAWSEEEEEGKEAGEDGEAGRYVEFESRGGIMGYTKKAKCAFIKTGPKEFDTHFLPMAYLSVYTEDPPHSSSSLLFTPGPLAEETPTTPLKSSKKKEALAFFPFASDGCSRALGSKPGLTECQLRSRAQRIIKEISRPKEPILQLPTNVNVLGIYL